MSQPAPQWVPQPDPLEHYSPEGVQHVWLPTHRSLCDLSSQRFEDATTANPINDRAVGLPVCGPCEVVVGMLERRLAELKDARTGTSPVDQRETVALLRETRWSWVSSFLR